MEYTRLIHHGYTPARCIIDDGNEVIDSIRNTPGCRWYLRGDYPAHHPVPARRGWNYITREDRRRGVRDDCVMIGATYVDWSRGYLEFY